MPPDERDQTRPADTKAATESPAPPGAKSNSSRATGDLTPSAHAPCEPATTPSPRPDRRYKISRLPKEIKAELDQRLMSTEFRSYTSLSRWLASKGFEISRAAL